MRIQNFKLGKTDKIIIYSVLFIPLLILFIFMMKGLFFDPKSKRDYFFEIRQTYNFHGTIDSIYRQKQNHNILTLMSENNILPIDRGWQNKFKIGDSISKNQGSLLVEHYRDGRLIEVLNYEDLLKE